MSLYDTIKGVEDSTSSDPNDGIFLCGFIDADVLDQLKRFDQMQSALARVVNSPEIADKPKAEILNEMPWLKGC